MNTPLLRLLTALAVLSAGGLLLALKQAWGLAVVALGFALLVGFARDGGVSAAFAAFKRGDLPAVRRALGYNLWPRLLSRRKSAYQHWMLGVLDASECRFPAAREQLLLAAAGDIQTENDRCLIQCLLAEVALRLEDWAAAQEHLRLARNLDHHQQVDGMISTVERRLQDRVTEVVQARAAE